MEADSPENGACAHPALSGPVLGDIAGSTHEGRYDKVIPEQLIGPHSHFTDDTVLTCAVAAGLQESLFRLDRAALSCRPEMQAQVVADLARAIKSYARRYPQAGYGSRFRSWVESETLAGYHSYGNGAAMRCAFAGWYAKTLAEAQLFGALTARPTHNHPDAEEAAAVVAACIFILQSGGAKKDLLAFARTHYDLSFTLDALRPVHACNITGKGTVMVALVCFLESGSFAHALGLAISMGGDCDTLAAVTGSLAEAYYAIPGDLLAAGLSRLDDALLADLRSATRVLRAHGLWRPGTREGAEPLRCRCTWQEPDAGANNSLDPRTSRA